MSTGVEDGRTSIRVRKNSGYAADTYTFHVTVADPGATDDRSFEFTLTEWGMDQLGELIPGIKPDCEDFCNDIGE